MTVIALPIQFCIPAKDSGNGYREKLEEILKDEILSIAEFYDILSKTAVKIMKMHAPKAICGMVEEIIEQTIFFRTVGIIGVLAVHSGEMKVPQDKGVKPMLICDHSCRE